MECLQNLQESVFESQDVWLGKDLEENQALIDQLQVRKTLLFLVQDKINKLIQVS